MSLPEIPEDAVREAEVMIGLDTWTRSPTCGICTRRPEACPEHAARSLLEVAWPHLYAAALHHVADEWDNPTVPRPIRDLAQGLRDIADEATT